MADARDVKTIEILGSTMNMVDVPFILEWIAQNISEYREKTLLGESVPTKQMVVTGFHGLNQANNDPNYFKIGAECDLWVPDSISSVLIAKRRGMKGSVRTPGAEIMKAFLEKADSEGLSSYFYGDTDHTLNALRENLTAKYPGHVIAGAFSPPYRKLTDEEEQEHCEMINAAKPDVLWVGLGLPKQDEWIYRNKHRLKVPVCAGVGAAFGFMAGTMKRAPEGWQKCGLEWLYMLLTKPKRTGRRVFVDGSEFISAIIREEFRLSKKSGKKK